MDNAPIDAFASAIAMLEALNKRQVSAAELLDLHLRRIERYNPVLNAIVTFDVEHARHAAMAADEARARGEHGALLGLPVTIKDTIDVKGLPGTAGVERYKDRRPAHDAPLVVCVRAARAVIIGKTNVPPYAGDWQAINPVFGRTNNPWDLSRTPGGSTGGGAAALAAGLTPLEFGSDIGGSIRIPAAFCRIFGHKPSETAVPRSGHFPGTPLPNTATVLSVLGPLARDANDLELALDVIAGPEVGEDTSWHLQLPPARHDRLADFRVAVLPPLPWLPVDAEILAAQDACVSALHRAGCHVETAAPEGFGDFSDWYELYLKLLFVMMFVGEQDHKRRQQADMMRLYGERYLKASADGIMAGASDYIIWHGQRETYRALWRAFFREWDVVLSPANIVPAFPHTEAPFQQRTLTIDGVTVPYSRQSAYAGIATLAGQPATAFPVGMTGTGLPIGLQAIGPYLEDYTPIRFASLVSRELGGFRPPPGYDEHF
jgi:amidase